MGKDQEQEQAKEQNRKREPCRPAFCHFPILGEDARPQADDADADAGEEIGGIEQDAAGLNWKRVMARLEPGAVAEPEMHRQIGHDRDDNKGRKGHCRPAAKGVDQTAERAQDFRRCDPDRGGNDVEYEQHPQEP